MKPTLTLLLVLCNLMLKAQDHETFKTYTSPFAKLNVGYTFNNITTNNPNLLSYNTSYTPAIASSVGGGIEIYIKKWLYGIVGFNVSFNSFKKTYGGFNYKNAFAGGQYLFAPVTQNLTIRNFMYELPLGVGVNFNGFKTNVTFAPAGVFYYYDANSFAKVNYIKNGLKVNTSISIEYVVPIKKIGLGVLAQQTYLLNSLQLDYRQGYVLKLHPFVTSLGISIYFNNATGVGTK
jgi:hypothetical protein